VAVRETRYYAQAHIASGTPSLAVKQTKMAAEFGGFCSSVSVMAALELHVCCCRTWSSNQSGSEVILAFSGFFDQIPRQESEISASIFSPTKRQQNPTVLLDPEGG
jgi:hypothetical protein